MTQQPLSREEGAKTLGHANREAVSPYANRMRVTNAQELRDVCESP